MSGTTAAQAPSNQGGDNCESLDADTPPGDSRSIDPAGTAAGPCARLHRHPMGSRTHRRCHCDGRRGPLPGVHRLEAKDWISSEWGLSENNRRAKYYGLTAAGRRQLRVEVETWKRYAAAMHKVIEPA